MEERYNPKQMRIITDALSIAQNAIEAIVVEGEEERIFDYRTTNPKLYKMYMDINEIACEAFELYDN